MFKKLFLLQYFLFWLLYFAINRIIFELWNAKKFTEIPISEILKTFQYGAHMDASTAAYFCTFPFILHIMTWFIPKTAIVTKKIISYYTYLLLVVCSLLTVIDLNIYTEWGAKLNSRAFSFFFNSPSEAIASSSSSPIFLSLLILTLLITSGSFLFHKLAKKTLDEFKHSFGFWYFKIPLGIIVLGLTFLVMRGGWGIAPMNPSKSYFSNRPILNHSALNTYWLLVENIISQSNRNNPYQFFPVEENREMIAQIFNRADSSQTEILKMERPNLVFVILESFTADVVKELGGESNITPAFSKLINDGLFFTNIYSASDRTDKGLIAILSAFPSQAIRSIISENDKQEKLPSIMESLISNGRYHTSFFYGGDIDFSNFGSYLFAHQTHTIFDSHQLPPEKITSKWGAFDEVTMDEHLKFLSSEKQPFFSTLLTLSNHEPFALPRPGTFNDNSPENKFKNTSQYTAECLLDYVERAKKQAWYKNTLFVIVADHGHRLPKNTNEIYMHQRYRIPLLIMGGALKNEFKGEINNKFGGQTDIIPSILSQMHIADSIYTYGNNLFLRSNNDGFSFYCWDNGFGLVNKQVAVSIDGVSRRIIFTHPEGGEERPEIKKAANQAKAIMQSIYQDYLDL